MNYYPLERRRLFDMEELVMDDQPHREETDESLRAERVNAEQACGEARAIAQERADLLLECARRRADEVLVTARDREDEVLEAAEPGMQARADLALGRAQADELVQDERDLADETLRQQRETQARVLAGLRPLERERTDRDLLTERRRSDARLEHRDDFLGMVSHDLRNLLCGIVLEASYAADQASDSAEGQRTVAGMKRLERYAARMNGLIGDLVDVVSIDAGTFSIRRERCEVGTLLGEAVDSCTDTAQQKGIAITRKPLEAALFADCDRDRVLQVFANLLNNALKFTPGGGDIAIDAKPTEAGLRFTVTDSGIGIEHDVIEAVFRRFWRVAPGDSKGLGLGLYISKNIVEAHGGSIWVDSKVGEGSSFWFTLPDQAQLAA